MKPQKSSSNQYNSALQRERGFTLIELIAVIVILAILSATAVSKFASFSNEANAAVIRGLLTTLQSSSQLIWAGCSVDASCDISAGPAAGNGLGNSISASGQNITLAYGFPRATNAGIVRAAGIRDLADGGKFRVTSFTQSGRTGIRIRLNDDVGVNQCEVRYQQPAAATEAPVFNLVTSGC